MIDLDQFIERAAIREFQGGQSRFAAETAAAAEQGCKRHEAINAIRAGHSQEAQDNRSADAGRAAHDLPGVQSYAQQKDRSMSGRGVQA